jgi:hypothetical protein
MKNTSKVLCRFVFCGAEEEDAGSLLLGCVPTPTVSVLRSMFPFEGAYHFRLQETIAGGGSSSATYVWRDLVNDEEELPAGEAIIKVLQLSPIPQTYPIYSVQVDDNTILENEQEKDEFLSFFEGVSSVK